MEINFSTKECNLKIVYYGPGLSGKTTNLEVIHARTPEDNRGKLTAIATDQDRTLFFDYMPLELGEIGGLKIRLRLFTVPGQVYYNATRKVVLRCVDGIVFVADSQEHRKNDNLDSLENLRENLRDYGLKLEDVPLVMQFNKRDLPNIMSLEMMDAILNSTLKVPCFPAVAIKGDGVFQCLKNIANLTIQKVEETVKTKTKKRTISTSKPQTNLKKPGTTPLGTPKLGFKAFSSSKDRVTPTPLSSPGILPPRTPPFGQRRINPLTPPTGQPLFRKNIGSPLGNGPKFSLSSKTTPLSQNKINIKPEMTPPKGDNSLQGNVPQFRLNINTPGQHGNITKSLPLFQGRLSEDDKKKKKKK